MMPAVAGPFISLMFSTLFMLTLVRFSPLFAIVVVVLAASTAAFLFAQRRKKLPRWIMDILERLSDKAVLERAYEKRKIALSNFDAHTLFDKLSSQVVGQSDAIKAICHQLRRRLMARRPDKPVAVICLAGPPGVGKTHFAKVLARELHAGENHLHFFDMSQFSQPHAAASLFGQARGYVGSTSYGSLTAALRDQPDCVVLLDEFEKAHPDVHKRFLTAWNDGFVTETSDGAKVPTNEAIFILTTNAASRRIGEIARTCAGNPDEIARLTKKALEDAQFAPEVLSRIDDVFAFRNLEGLDIARVVAIEIEKLAKGYGLSISDKGIDPNILFDSISRLTDRTDGGVRDIARAIEREVTDSMIEARQAGATSIRVERHGNSVVAIPADEPVAEGRAAANEGRHA
jgi:ATP-dependent Clp protease ATP-binding subunit ClpA